MKTLTIITVSLFFSLTTLAQRVTYNNLLFVLRHTPEEADDYLGKKGFSFAKVDTLSNNEDERLNQVSYEFRKNSKYSTFYISVEKHANKEIFYEASFYTLMQSDYQKFKESIKSLGFTANGTDVRNGDMITYFKKGNLEVSFMQHRVERDGEDDVTDYYITLTDKSLMFKIWKIIKGNQ